MGGSAVSNCTSTTAPITWETLPTCSGCDFELGPLNKNPLGVFQVGRTLESIGVTSHQHKIDSQTNLGINSWKTQLKYLKFWKLKERLKCELQVTLAAEALGAAAAAFSAKSRHARGSRAEAPARKALMAGCDRDGLHNAWGQRCHE